MRLIHRAALAFALSSGASAAQADEYFAVTPSGAAEELFDGSARATTSAIASKCIDDHWTVISSTELEVTCEAPMNFGQQFLGQLLLGNGYSTPPRRFFRFNVAEVGDVARVQASGWMELQMAFGQTRRTDFAGASFQNGMIAFMSTAGGRLPPGTKFPNHVLMGFNSRAPDGGAKGLLVTEVVPDSAAALAGIRAGDILTRIAGKSVKNEDDAVDGMAKATAAPTYQVELMRDGKKQVVTLSRRFREDVVAPDPTQITRLAEQGGSRTQAVASQSTADELAKFADLRDRGVITAEEFEAQKRKLLDGH